MRGASWLGGGLLLFLAGNTVSQSSRWWALPLFLAGSVCVAQAVARHRAS